MAARKQQETPSQGRLANREPGQAGTERPESTPISRTAPTHGGRTRADQRLVELGLATSRAQAQALVLAGRVYLGPKRLEKPATPVEKDAPLTVLEGPRFVSRGGNKLDAALRELQVSVAGLTCVDVGASTGGFTDCLLQRGAARVYAVDVGRGKLDTKLRRDARVVVQEGVNARYLERAAFAERIELVVIDASFISLSKLLPAVASWLDPGGMLLALVKPQFEAGRVEASRGRGIIRNPEVRARAIARARSELEACGFEVLAGVDSALPGRKGNREHFVLAVRR